MAQSKEQAIERAKKDLAKRLKVSENEITEAAVETADFPDMSLGAPEKGEMSGQMITSGWRISLAANNKKYEYRADKDDEQLRLFKFNGGANYKI